MRTMKFDANHEAYRKEKGAYDVLVQCTTKYNKESHSTRTYKASPKVIKEMTQKSKKWTKSYNDYIVSEFGNYDYT